MSDLSGGDAGRVRRPIAKSELLFRQLLDTLPAAAYTCDAEGLITYFNRRAVEVWGRTPRILDPIDRFCGSFKLLSGDGTPIDHDQCWMALALRTGKPCVGEEIVIEQPEGQRLTVLAHASPLRDRFGKVTGAVNVLVDVGDRQRADHAQTLMAAIVESSEDAIISTSTDGRILTWNGGAERLFGYSAGEAIGAPISLIVPPEKRDEETAILARLRRGERIQHFETVRVSKQGKRIEISLTFSPIRDRSGRIVGASKVARDIGARKQAEQALLALHNQMTAQIEDLRRLCNMSRRLATTLELRPILEETLRAAAAIEGTDLGLLSLGDDAHDESSSLVSLGFDQQSVAIVAHLPPMDQESETRFENYRVMVEDVDRDPSFAECRDAARRVGFRAMHSTQLVARSGKVVGILSLYFRGPHRPGIREQHLIDLCARQAVDFIENAQLYDELRAADQRKEEFLATLAHELRNPLAPICNSLHLLRLSGDVGAAHQNVLEIMERQVDHLVRLVDDLLEVSRISSGKIELRKETIALAAVVRNAVETSQPAINAAGHQLAISLPPEPLMIEADPVRLAQVFANLLNNAAKYTKEGGQIWLTVRKEDGQVAVSVRDNGVGIPADVLPRIFDMFTQADESLSMARGGLGIGLTLARSLAELHGGSIEARSEGTGKGSEFLVHLPLARGQIGANYGLGEHRSAAGDESPPRKILVVDDSNASAVVLGKLLEKMGHHVRTATNAATAMEYARSDRPEILISDIAMPDVDGYELARRLRQEPGFEKLLLVALTGYGQHGDRERALEAGFNLHLIKPVSIESLEELLHNLPARDLPASLSPGGRQRMVYLPRVRD